MAHLMRRSFTLAQDANAQVPSAVGLSVRHYSELSDAEQGFLCRGLMPQGIAARAWEMQQKIHLTQRTKARDARPAMKNWPF
jgi:hypothetical protein